tara:strand:- start:79 stop:372 length:294 start_codon:yes stop_codon:yes gene_type:complete
MKALISNNKVVDVQASEFEVHPSLTWVDCGDTVKVGHTYDSSKKTFTDPDVATAEQGKAGRDALAARVAAQKSGNDKLLGLGLTQEEATALTGYKPS